MIQNYHEKIQKTSKGGRGVIQRILCEAQPARSSPTMPTPPDPYDTKHPLFSFRASGQVNKEKVFYVRAGRQCVRSYIIPTDPKTPPQRSWRLKFKEGVAAWHNLSTAEKLFWRRIGVRKKEPITSLNAFLSWWMKTAPTPPPPPPPTIHINLFGWDLEATTWRKVSVDPDGAPIVS